MEPPPASFVAPAAPAHVLPSSARRPAPAAPPVGLVRRLGRPARGHARSARVGRRPGRRREEAACCDICPPQPARTSPGRRLCCPVAWRQGVKHKENIEHMMKSKEALTMKTLGTKLLINENKKEVKLAQVEARREDAKRKADLEERMIKVKEAKAWKELMVKEKEHMMMSKKDMDEDQLMWW
ncbi:hypothetical protein ZWY2020_032481 [Hordeum vulgare]|nr:hypothetical protein ZWY2020_032481 [Hordeum vulgare]